MREEGVSPLGLKILADRRAQKPKRLSRLKQRTAGRVREGRHEPAPSLATWLEHSVPTYGTWLLDTYPEDNAR